MSILVTGGTGCLGHHILSSAIRSKGKLLSFGQDLPAPELSFKHVEYLKGDICDEKQLLEILRQHKPEEIYHAAAQNSVGISQIRPTDTIQSNILGTQILFECIRKTVPKAKVIFISSCEVYGGGRGVTQILHRENDAPAPMSAFATSKASGELLAKQYFLAHGMNIITVRPFHFMGPSQSTRYAIPEIAKQIAEIELHQGELCIYTGNLDVVRDYTDVRDIARGILMISQAGVPGEIYNICSGKGRTIREMVENLILLSGLPIEIRFDPKRERAVDIPLLVGSPEKIQSLTGWRPMIALDDSLKDVYTDLKNRLTMAEGLF